MSEQSMVSAIIIIIIAMILAAGVVVGAWLFLRRRTTTREEPPPPLPIVVAPPQREVVVQEEMKPKEPLPPPVVIPPNSIRHGDIVTIQTQTNVGIKGYLGICETSAAAVLNPEPTSFKVLFKDGSEGHPAQFDTLISLQLVSAGTYLVGNTAIDEPTAYFASRTNNASIKSEFKLVAGGRADPLYAEGLLIEHSLGHYLTNLLEPDPGTGCSGNPVSFRTRISTPGADKWVFAKVTAKSS